MVLEWVMCVFFFQAEDGIRDLVRSRGLGDVYKRQGNTNSVTDAGVGAFAVLGAVKGGFLNVLINVGGLRDKEKARMLKEEAQALLDLATEREHELWEKVCNKVKK